MALVTGAGGFIGSHLVETLLDAGWQVRCLIRYGSTGNLGHLAELEPSKCARLDIWRGDLLDQDFISRCARDVDTIFHLAARISIPYSYEAPRDTFEVNAIGTLNLLEAARQSKVRRFIHTSTSEVFGTAVTLPMDENHPMKAQSPYAASKIAADKLVESYVCSFDMAAITLRPFNTYGPRQSPRAVIPAIIQQALTRNEVHLGSLWPRRDFTFVGDTVSGFLCAAEADAAVGGAFNLGTGSDISIGELAKVLLELLEIDCPIIAEEPRQRPPSSEVGRLLSDNSHAREVLGWVPRVSLQQGLRITAEWWRRHAETFGWSGYAI